MESPVRAGAGEDLEFRRRLTLCWCRYDYRSRIYEADSLESLIDQARAGGADYLFVLYYGTIIREGWEPGTGTPGGFDQALLEWAGYNRFERLQDREGHYQFINLRTVHAGAAAPAVPPAGGTGSVLPEALSRRLMAPDGVTIARLQDLAAGRDGGCGDDRVSGGFLATVRDQLDGARRGVFLWNIESYADIEKPAHLGTRPLATLYSVCAGFKPLWILNTFGISPATRVVYFDYSANALAIRREMLDAWDGCDYPEFIRHLFGQFPYPDTFYQLWSGKTPAAVEGGELEAMWRGELARWGGAEEFRRFWERYRCLPHEFVCCNLLEGAPELAVSMRREDASVIWFSNAFFTIYGNIRIPIAERRETYEQWIADLASRNPDLILFGSDYNNDNVNGLAAGEYWERYHAAPGSELAPAGLYTHRIRM